MSYPKASAGEKAAAGVPASPRFPEIEERVLRLLGRRRHLPRERRGTSRRSADGTVGGNEFVFYDGPPFANGLPHYGHLLTGYVKDVVPRYRPCAAAGSSAGSAGTATGSPPRSRRRSSSGSDPQVADRRDGHRAVQRRLPRPRCCATPRTGRSTSTRQARWVDFEHDYKTLDLDYMESRHVGLQELCGTRAWSTRASGCLPYCWRCETPLSNTETRMDDVYRQRQDPAVTSASAYRRTRRGRARPDLDDDAVDPALQPGAGRASTTSTTSSSSSAASPARTERFVLAEARLAAYARELGDGRRRPGGSRADGRRAGRRSLHARRSTFFAGQPNAAPGARVPTSSPPTDGTGLVHIAPAFGEDDKIAHRRRPGSSRSCPGRRPGPVHRRRGAAVRRRCRCLERQQARSIARSERAGPSARRPGHLLLRQRDLRPPLPALLALPTTPLIYMAVSSWFVEVTADQGPDGRAQRADHAGCPSTSRTARSASGSRTPATGRSAATGSGAARSRSGSRDDPAYPRIDVYGSLDELRARLRRGASPTCTGRSSTS